ncbi:MAG: hypothetical protein HOC74_17670 [Gemmatimonadetes bacterium]|jgi:hypothetical protein|nr:hypothetical protein [Gemmatimonadota bacterium]
MCVFRAICSALLLTTAALAQEPVPIIELTDEALSFIELDDGSIADWEELLGFPAVLALDLNYETTVGTGGFEPEALDFAIWLGYHAATSRLYVAMERVDGDFVNEYVGEGNMLAHDGAIEVRVDGDRSGGDYAFDADCCEMEDEWKALNNRQAQSYAAILGADEQMYIRPAGAAEWTAAPPYASGGGEHRSDGHTVLEFYVTLFDELIWDSSEESVPTPMPSGPIGSFKSIGLDLIVPDYQNAPGNLHALPSLSGQVDSRASADVFAEAVLIAEDIHAECFGEDCFESAVRPLGWARIKIVPRL